MSIQIAVVFGLIPTSIWATVSVAKPGEHQIFIKTVCPSCKLDLERLENAVQQLSNKQSRHQLTRVVDMICSTFGALMTCCTQHSCEDPLLEMSALAKGFSVPLPLLCKERKLVTTTSEQPLEARKEDCSVDSCQFGGLCLSLHTHQSRRCTCVHLHCDVNEKASVCGSDGKIYQNRCFLRQKSCEEQKEIFEKSASFCKKSDIDTGNKLEKNSRDFQKIARTRSLGSFPVKEIRSGTPIPESTDKDSANRATNQTRVDILRLDVPPTFNVFGLEIPAQYMIILFVCVTIFAAVLCCCGVCLLPKLLRRRELPSQSQHGYESRVHHHHYESPAPPTPPQHPVPAVPSKFLPTFSPGYSSVAVQQDYEAACTPPEEIAPEVPSHQLAPVSPGCRSGTESNSVEQEDTEEQAGCSIVSRMSLPETSSEKGRYYTLESEPECGIHTPPVRISPNVFQSAESGPERGVHKMRLSPDVFQSAEYGPGRIKAKRIQKNTDVTLQESGTK